MENKITIHIVLCGLLSGANIIASEAANSAILRAVREASQHINSNSSSSSPQLSPRKNNTNDQLIQSSSGSLPIPIPQPNHSTSSSHSGSPSLSSSLLQQRASKKVLERLKNDSASEEEKASCKIECLYKKGSDETYHVINTHGLLAQGFVLDQQRNNSYKAQLVTKNNQFFVQPTHLIDTQQGGIMIPENDRPMVAANLTEQQISAILQETLSPTEKSLVFAIDSDNNSYCFNACVNKSIEENSLENSSASSGSEEHFVTITSKFGTPYKCLITHKTDDDSDDDSNKEYVVAIQTTSTSGKIYTLAKKPIPTNKNTYYQVLETYNNDTIVIDANHRFYRWDGDSTYTPLLYDTSKQTETTEKEESNKELAPKNLFAIITDEDNNEYQFRLVEYVSEDGLSNPSVDIWYKNPTTGELAGVGSEKIPTDEKQYTALVTIADKQTIVIDKDKNLYVWDGALSYIPQSNLNENGIITIAYSKALPSQSPTPSIPNDQPQRRLSKDALDIDKGYNKTDEDEESSLPSDEKIDKEKLNYIVNLLNSAAHFIKEIKSHQQKHKAHITPDKQEPTIRTKTPSTLTPTDDELCAIIFDSNGIKYECYIIEKDNGFYLELHQTNDENGKESYKEMSSTRIPTDDTYVSLRQIADQQFIYINKDHGLYINNHLGQKILQNNCDDNGTVIIQPLVITSSKQEEKTTDASTTNSNTSPLPRSAHPLAHITNINNREYLCCLSSDDARKIKLYLLNKDQNTYFSTFGVVRIPENDNEYAELINIDANQWIVVDKDHNFYIWDGDKTYTPQSIKNNNHPEEAFRNAICITPLPHDIKPSAQNNVSSPENKDHSNQKLTSSKETKRTEQINPNDSKPTKPMPLCIKATISVATFAALVGILYYYNKLPNIAELFNNLSHRIKNISFA